MSNAKRAIMVPVMTLAVCAIAMVGLGFALSSTVTSDNNTAAELMIDMNESNTYFETGGAGETSPGNGEVNSKLSLSITNKKTESTPGIEVKGGYAFIKVYGNVDETSYKLKVSSTTSNAPDVTFTLYTCSVSGNKATLTPYATTTLTHGEFSATPECNTVYVVAITKIGTCTLNYSGETGSVTEKVITLTPNVTYESTEESTEITSTVISGISYTFTATDGSS